MGEDTAGSTHCGPVGKVSSAAAGSRLARPVKAGGEPEPMAAGRCSVTHQRIRDTGSAVVTGKRSSFGMEAGKTDRPSRRRKCSLVHSKADRPCQSPWQAHSREGVGDLATSVARKCCPAKKSTEPGDLAEQAEDSAPGSVAKHSPGVRWRYVLRVAQWSSRHGFAS